MGLIITPKEQIDAYFESPALSQSVLKKLLHGLDAFLSNAKEESELYYEEKGHFIIGSAVDCILTGEDGDYERLYHISSIEKKPSDVEMSILNLVFDYVMQTTKLPEVKDLSQYPGFIQQSIEEHNWQANWKMETKINKIIEVGSIYFEDLKIAHGKQVISFLQNQLITDIARSLQTNPRTAHYFDREKFANSENIDIYYQFPIYFNYRDIECKALMDILIVFKDEDNKPISIHPIDLKTMNGPTIKFSNNLKSFRYDIQAAWYTQGLLSIEEFKDCVIKPFTFIVESNSNPGKPLIYEITKKVLNIGKYGRADIKLVDTVQLFMDDDHEDVVIGKEIIGFESLLNDYIFYEENGWDEDKTIKLNQSEEGVLLLGWEGIKEYYGNTGGEELRQ